MRLIKGFFASFLLLTGLALQPAWAAAPKVEDNAKIFGAEAVKKANAIIAEIEEKYKKDLVIETFSKVPAGKKDEFNKVKDDRKKRDQFLDEWALEEAKDERVKGI